MKLRILTDHGDGGASYTEHDGAPIDELLDRCRALVIAAAAGDETAVFATVGCGGGPAWSAQVDDPNRAPAGPPRMKYVTVEVQGTCPESTAAVRAFERGWRASRND